VIGSGLARTRDEQMQVLARNAARQIQRWMLDNPEWFSIDPDAPPFRTAAVETDPADPAESTELVAPAEAPDTPLDIPLDAQPGAPPGE
jgi:hypothetical protein